MDKGNTLLLKKINKSVLRNEFKNLQKATIKELAENSKLSVVTVKSLLEEMLASGEAFEGKSVPSGGGRPSVQYLYNPDYLLGITIYSFQKNKRIYVKASVINLDGNCIHTEEFYPEEIVVESFEPVIEKLSELFPQIVSISFGLPGFETDADILYNDYSNLEGVGFLAHYREKYKIPVSYYNDINAAVKGFYAYKSPYKSGCIVGVYFPGSAPPGSGLLFDGDIYLGKNSFAGEIGRVFPIHTDWRALNYEKEEILIPLIGEICAVFSSILAPEQIVLYGDFFKEGISDKLRYFTEELLHQQFSPVITISNDFEEDFGLGMGICMVSSLEDQLKKENE